MPGIGATACFRRATISSTHALRSSRGRSVMASRPAFGVGLIGLTPTTETTPVTSGSCADRVLDLRLQPLHLGERHFGARPPITAMIRPVSCGGRKPFGMTM